jgi:hypothetical protein
LGGQQADRAAIHSAVPDDVIYIRPPARLRIEKVEVAVEDNQRRCLLTSRPLQHSRERMLIAVQPTHGEDRVSRDGRATAESCRAKSVRQRAAAHDPATWLCQTTTDLAPRLSQRSLGRGLRRRIVPALDSCQSCQQMHFSEKKTPFSIPYPPAASGLISVGFIT